MDQLTYYIEKAISFIKNVFKRIINGILNFAQHVVAWFKGLNLNRQHHVPFIADASKIRTLIKNAPVKNVGIFEGVYNTETDTIDHNILIEADSVDSDTMNTLGNEVLVTLC